VQKIIRTNSTELSCSSEANRFSASQESLCIIWKPLVHYRIHNSLPPVPILNQINPVHAPSHFLKMHFNIIYPSTPGSSKWSPCFRFPLQNLACTSPLPNTCYIPCSSHSSRFDHRIFGEQYRSLSSSLCSLLHSPVTLSLLGPIFSSAYILKYSRPTFLSQCERLISTPIQDNRQNYSSGERLVKQLRSKF